MRETQKSFPPLETVQRPTVGTVAAAFYLGRHVGTLHRWAASGEGPIKPRRIGDRFEWPTRDLRSLLGVEPAHG